jgi:hypothetical protein
MSTLTPAQDRALCRAVAQFLNSRAPKAAASFLVESPTANDGVEAKTGALEAQWLLAPPPPK